MEDEDRRRRREDQLTSAQLKSDTFRSLAEEINVNPDEVRAVVLLKARGGCIMATLNEVEIEPGGRYLTSDEYIEHIKEDVSQLCTEVEGYYVAVQVMANAVSACCYSVEHGWHSKSFK